MLALAVGVSGVVNLGTPAAQAMVYPFEVFTVGGPSFSGNVTVVEGAFTFRHTADTGSSITGVYFSNAFDNAILSTLAAPPASQTPSVEFVSLTPVEPLPSAPGDFETSSAFTSTSLAAGVGYEESLTLTGTFSGQAFADVQAAVAGGGIGVRVQNGSNSSSTSATTVTNPLPAAAWLFMSALGGLFGWRRWMRREDAADGVAT